MSIFLTKADLERLRELVRKEWARSASGRYLAKLQAEIDKATVVDAADIHSDVVTMHSTVELTDLDTGETETYTLVFPEEADIVEGRISVLAPIGTAVLGYRVGDEFEWKVPAGTRRLRVSGVLYQPEASGDWDD